MPLSEHELRTLEQMEAQLYAEDPKFAHAMQHDPVRRRRRQRALMVTAVALTGLGLVIAAGALKQTWLGLVGVLLIAVGALLSLQVPWPHLAQETHDQMRRDELRDLGATQAPSGASSVASLPRQARVVRAQRPTTPFMMRMEERWERRRRETQGW